MSRGLDRLRRVAREEGIEFPDDLPGEDQTPTRTLEPTEEESDR